MRALLRPALLPLLLVPLSAAAPAAAQEAVPVGSDRVRGEALREGTDTLFLFTVREEGAAPAALMTLRTVRVADGDGDRWVRTERTFARGGRPIAADSFEVDARTLAPLSAVSETPEARTELRYEPGHARGTVRSREGVRPLYVALDEPAFHGASTDMLLAALPLREGFAARLPVLDPTAEEAHAVTARVEGRERVRTVSGGEVDAWRVAVEEGERETTYWIADEPRTLVAYRAVADGVRLELVRGGWPPAEPADGTAGRTEERR